MKRLAHPKYGLSRGKVKGFVARGNAYVSGYWGNYRIYANLPLTECKIVSEDDGGNTD